MERQRSNPFDLLRDDDHEDPSQLIAAVKQPQKITPIKASQSKLPSKPLPPPPQQAVKEAKKNEAARTQTSQSRFPRRGAYGANREFRANGHDASTQVEGGRSGEAPQGSYGYANGDVKDSSVHGPRRTYGRYNSTNRRPDVKGDEFHNQFTGKGSKEENAEKLEKNRPVDDGKTREDPQKEEEKEPEDKEMTLEEYEKIMEERKKALASTKTEERKVKMDKVFESMKQLCVKKETDEVFIQLGSNKDATKKKETERQEKTKKSLNINEFLRPAQGQNYNRSGGRGRRDTRSAEGQQTRGNLTSRPVSSDAAAPLINDPSHFPTLVVN